MKCLDKKRIKMKGGESLALNERAMLSLVSTGRSRIFLYEVHIKIHDGKCVDLSKLKSASADSLIKHVNEFPLARPLKKMETAMYNLS
ncbi:hypothetical protein ACTXT7_015567 [Hymenolepis weldensis]